MSVSMIANSGISPEDRIIDIGGGASTLVDNLLSLGYGNISVLDISLNAIKLAKKRLQQKAEQVEWIEADITSFKSSNTFSLWHDRAVFHFLTSVEDQQKYVNILKKCLNKGGTLIIAAFSLDGPSMCSGLKTMRYDAASLSRVLDTDFSLLEEVTETHITPKNVKQKFTYYRFVYG